MLNKYFGYTISNSIAVEYQNNIFIFSKNGKVGSGYNKEYFKENVKNF